MVWLHGWENVVPLAIDHTVIDAPQTDFPARFHLAAASGKTNRDLSAVFTEVGANSKKIAVTTSDGITQCPVEIELWDNVGSEAELWVKVPAVSAAVDTLLYLYYDGAHADNTTYVGDVNTVVGASVWDADYVLVDHMQDYGDTSHTVDSTSNSNDGVKTGAAEPVEVAGAVGVGQNFDGVNDVITVADALSLDVTNLTLSATIKKDVLDTQQLILAKKGVNTYHGVYSLWASNNIAQQRLFFRGEAGGAGKYWTSNNVVFTSTTDFYHVAFTYDGTTPLMYVDGALVASAGELAGVLDTSAEDLVIGRREANDAPNWFDGIIDEVRISKIARPAAWVKASYYSEADDLITYDAPVTSGAGETIYFYPEMWPYYTQQKRKPPLQNPPDSTKVDWSWEAVESEDLTRKVDYVLKEAKKKI